MDSEETEHVQTSLGNIVSALKNKKFGPCNCNDEQLQRQR